MADKPEDDKIVAYKGFDKSLKCRGMQYEIGKTFTHEGEVSACTSGLHSCEYPLDVLSYYPPAESRYCVVSASGELSRHDGDTKIASAHLHIETEINISELTARAIEYVKSRLNKSNKIHNTGDQSAASNTGYRSAASNTGDHSAASNTGNHSAASNTGDQSAASNTGNPSAASNTGDQSAASNTGKNAIAIASGKESKAMASEGSAIVLCSYDSDGTLKHVKSAIAGKKYSWGKIKPNTWYTLTEKGRFKEVG